MPISLSYPGVYVEEVPSGVRTIVGVSTSDTAFVDVFARGPVNEPTRVTSFGDFERTFGGLTPSSEASYAIQQFYLNGGSVAWVVRVAASAEPAFRILRAGEGQGAAAATDKTAQAIRVEAASPGTWGNSLQFAVDKKTRAPASEFNLVVRQVESVNGRPRVLATEVHRNLSFTPGTPRFAESVVNDGSELVRVKMVDKATLPPTTATDAAGDPATAEFLVLGKLDYQIGDKFQAAKAEWTAITGAVTVGEGKNGTLPGSTGWTTAGQATLIGNQLDKTGLYALEKLDRDAFNLLCIPAAASLPQAAHLAVMAAATKYCGDRRAFFLADPPSSLDDQAGVRLKIQAMNTWLTALETAGGRHRNAAVFFPRLSVTDPLNEGRPRVVAPSGTLAGVFARTDASRGVWKAPAGTEATLRGAAPDGVLTDLENGPLNQNGVNVLRTLPVYGSICWGSRTLDGADQQASEWKYVPVRRIALFIEESLFRGLKWVVFEPNDEPLWAQIRLNVGAFLNTLFRQGAFQGRTPRDAYFVKCDRETTPQADIDRGVVNVTVGFAPLKPAEFVVIRIQQKTAEVEA